MWHVHGVLVNLLGLVLGLAVIAALIVIGLLIIILLVKAFIMLLPAGLVAAAVWLLTGDLGLAAIAFVVVALLSLIKLL
ncbi:MAG: hypothetical protein DRJ96_08050 [Thermoprotei archaeon]|nr:MAG: hypothetical protein DRJ96_08050 [Thermoprotei archaeon]